MEQSLQPPMHVLSCLPSFLPAGKNHSKPERKSFLAFTRITAVTLSALALARFQEMCFHAPISPSSNHGCSKSSNAGLSANNLFFWPEWSYLWCNKSMNQYLQASLKRRNRLTQQGCWQISEDISWYQMGFNMFQSRSERGFPRKITVPGSV